MENRLFGRFTHLDRSGRVMVFILLALLELVAEGSWDFLHWDTRFLLVLAAFLLSFRWATARGNLLL